MRIFLYVAFSTPSRHTAHRASPGVAQVQFQGSSWGDANVGTRLVLPTLIRSKEERKLQRQNQGHEHGQTPKSVCHQSSRARHANTDTDSVRHRSNLGGGDGAGEGVEEELPRAQRLQRLRPQGMQPTDCIYTTYPKDSGSGRREDARRSEEAWDLNLKRGDGGRGRLHTDSQSMGGRKKAV